MPAFLARTTRPAVLALLLAAGAAQAQEAVALPRLAPGFSARPAGSRLVIVPADLELYSISAGGLVEPRADWTEQAQKNLAAALAGETDRLGPATGQLTLAQMDDFAEVAALHRAVAGAISIHHLGNLKLPTKGGRLDWSLVAPLKARTGADYALFTYLRDSYASTERKMAMIGMALIGAVMPGGEQNGYASLVDLHTGRVVWFSGLDRMWGDLRDGGSAKETVDALLKGFPQLQ